VSGHFSLQQRFFQWRRGHAVLIGLAIALISSFLTEASFFQAVELKTLDARFRMRGNLPLQSPITVVFIGDDSIKAFGRWPWSWDHHALLIDTLKRAGARQILYDIFFSESPGEQEAGLLAGVTEMAGNVYYCSHFTSLEETPSDGFEGLLRGVGLNEPIAVLAGAAAGVGHCNAKPDIDGSSRKIPLVVHHGGRLYPSASLKAALDYLGTGDEALTFRGAGQMEIPRTGGPTVSLPFDRGGQSLINFLGDPKVFPSYSFRQVLEADRYPGQSAVDLSEFKDRIVLVGVTFAGNTDLRPTPFAADSPMVYTLATAVDNILQNTFLRNPPATINWGSLLALGALAGFLTFSFRALTSLVAGAALGFAYLAGAQLLFSSWRWNLQVLAPLLTILSTYIVVTSVRYFLEERRAREIRKMFSNYATERLVNAMVADPGLARLGGERREITVLFADIRGFTSFSEKHSAEEVVSLLNEYLGAMSDIVFRWEGTLDKFIGDAIVAFWGAPLDQPNHAELALRCSLHMINRVEELQSKWSAEGKVPWSIGIGLNSGEVIVGNIGAEGKKMDYTVIGDPVNLGARVESLTRRMKSNILLTEFTLERIRGLISAGTFGHLAVRGMGMVTVKGKEDPVSVFQVFSKEPGSGSEIEDGEWRAESPR
jgi:adenylate cyclase